MKGERSYEVELRRHEKRKELKIVLIDFFLDLGLEVDDAKVVQELFFALKFKAKEKDLEVISRKLTSKWYSGKIDPKLDTVGFRVLINQCIEMNDRGHWKMAAANLEARYPNFHIENQKDLDRILNNYKEV
ncbi:MAG: hypothetical protein ACW977_07940 [Candidatus Thorarchaeota archaeon]|jgi:isocitrate dehydrogenase kinase/phosphatase